MKIAINGFGRIGRVFYRQSFDHPDIEVVAINDLGDKDNLIYLLERDSVYGKFKVPEKIHGARFLSERDPAKLPWKELGVDVVVEATGVFESYDKAKLHLDAGAKRVVITAPAKDEGETATFTPNVGIDAVTKSKITSNASCTTNAVAPILAVMMQSVGVKKAMLNTTHGYTATQSLTDSPNKNFLRGRAAAVNIIPFIPGAAIATAKAIPGMKGKFDGTALRVPVASGSIIDFVFVSEKPTTRDEINNILREAEKQPEWKGILKTSDESLVSTDILGEPYGSIADLDLTRVVDGDLVKISAWYDNEWGYAAMLIKHVEALKNFL